MKNYILALFIISSFASTAQTVPVGSPVIENYLRRQQLLGKLDSSFSFNYRPITVGKNGLNLSLEDYELDGFFGQKKDFLKIKGILDYYPQKSVSNMIIDTLIVGMMVR